jgi:hypothetical protein
MLFSRSLVCFIFCIRVLHLHCSQANKTQDCQIHNLLSFSSNKLLGEEPYYSPSFANVPSVEHDSLLA